VRDAVPENTILAFEHSLNLGADGVEFDVQICSDGKLVVFHDTTLERMTAGNDNRNIADIPSSEVRRVQLGQGATIPTFSEVLNWANSRCPYLNIELKTNCDDASALVTAVENEISESACASLMSRLLISSFTAKVLTLANEHNWPWPFARLLGPDDPVRAYDEFTNCGVHAHYSLVSEAQNISLMHKCKFINVWTVNTQSAVTQLACSAVDGIITDYPDLARNAVE
jgi:glycerophosphoryl diester phosphodiesterase